MEYHAIAMPPLPEDLGKIPVVIIADTIERLLAELDVREGDPDLEETGTEDGFMAHHANGPGCPVADAGELYGDETDGNFAEDEPAASHHLHGSGPGCTISDPGGYEDGF